MPGNVVVAGAAMTPFVKPSTSDTYDVLGSVAARAALKAAGVEYSDVQQVYAGYVYGDSCSGQRVVYNLGMTGVPVFNQNNNCATALAPSTLRGRRSRPESSMSRWSSASNRCGPAHWMRNGAIAPIRWAGSST